MPTLTETIKIAAPLGTVWPLLSDPATVASCIPGATLSPDREDDLWKGSISVKFGPTVAVFRGEAELTYDHDAHTCTIEGRGIDQRGASRALANGLVTAAAAGDQTDLTVQGEYTVSGPLETFANAGGIHVARALLGEFAANMSNLTGAAPAANDAAGTVAGEPYQPVGEPASAIGSSSTARPRTSGTELNAFALLWAALKSWVSSLFGKRK
jgi:carbon monoxide dehydrogenase subunit G